MKIEIIQDKKMRGKILWELMTDNISEIHNFKKIITSNQKHIIIPEGIIGKIVFFV